MQPSRRGNLHAHHHSVLRDVFPHQRIAFRLLRLRVLGVVQGTVRVKIGSNTCM